MENRKFEFSIFVFIGKTAIEIPIKKQSITKGEVFEMIDEHFGLDVEIDKWYVQMNGVKKRKVETYYFEEDYEILKQQEYDIE